MSLSAIITLLLTCASMRACAQCKSNQQTFQKQLCMKIISESMQHFKINVPVHVLLPLSNYCHNAAVSFDVPVDGYSVEESAGAIQVCVIVSGAVSTSFTVTLRTQPLTAEGIIKCNVWRVCYQYLSSKFTSMFFSPPPSPLSLPLPPSSLQNSLITHQQTNRSHLQERQEPQTALRSTLHKMASWSPESSFYCLRHQTTPALLYQVRNSSQYLIQTVSREELQPAYQYYLTLIIIFTQMSFWSFKTRRLQRTKDKQLLCVSSYRLESLEGLSVLLLHPVTELPKVRKINVSGYSNNGERERKRGSERGGLQSVLELIICIF